MMGWLGQQQQDATWDQESAVKQLLEWTKGDKPLYSFDLTAATDRWPKGHQKLVITALFGKDWANAWDWCLSTPAYVPHLKEEVKYRVGQPMGAYASWAALAISHHFLIRYAASIVGEPAEYKVLGDDVVIRGHKLAHKYLEIVKSLGVTISLGKSVLHKEGQPIAFEFAKNIGCNGVNLTAVSPNLLKEIWVDYQTVKFLDLIRLLRDQYGISGITYPEKICLPPLLHNLYKTLPRKDQEIVAILLSHPLNPIVPLAKEGTIDSNEEVTESNKPIPNPWVGYGTATVTKVQTYLSMRRSTNLIKTLLDISEEILNSRLTMLDEESSGRSEDIASNFVDSLYHPIWRIISSLVMILRDLVDNSDENPSKTRMVQIECEFVTKLLRGKLDVRSWEHSKLLRLRKNKQLARELHLLLTSYKEKESDLLFHIMDKRKGLFTSMASQIRRSENLWRNQRNSSGLMTDSLWTSLGGKTQREE
jgi:hypothetical protein